MTSTYHRSSYAAVAAALVLASGFAAAAEPQVSFTYMPAYGSTENLVGRVENVDCATHAVAVYIFVDTWWIKPSFEAPLSPIAPDGAWTCDITTGGLDIYAMQLAAYVVPIDYAPPLAAGWAQLPDELAANAVASVRATRPYTRRIWFSGYEWSVKDSHGQTTGPGNNVFSDSTSNVWVDKQGRLHLKICRRNGVWSCAEVVSVRSFGHGTYQIFADTAADALDARAVLGLFTWNDDAPFAHREIDIELSRWGNAADSNNAQYVVQPWESPGHLTRYRVPPDVTNATYSFSWRTNRIDFATYAGHVIPPPSAGGEIAAWSFAGTGLPQPGGENYRINLWLCNTSGTTDGEDEEVVISRFAFVP
ncbi:MAG: hypothetical protein GX617_07750 [Lentisphaerae bacterium]|nr:hypothetical protein [Lentisphaerota bacterium]